jgi:hypothetical protein
MPGGGGTLPGRAYGRGAQTPLQLIQYAKPNLVVYFPFDRDTYDRNNPTIPLDIVGHPVFNAGAYMRPGRLRDSERFGPLAPMFIAVPSAPNALALDMSQYCTIAAWVLPERLGGFSGSNNETILSRGVTSIDPSLSYCLYLSPTGVPTFESRIPPNYPNPGVWTRQANRSVGLGMWRHVAVVFNAGTINFYIDGQLAGQSTAPARAVDGVRLPECPVYIATRFVNNQTNEIRDPYFGHLDDLALWNRPLKPDEITLLVTDADGNGMADFWDLQITGYLPAPMSGANPTSGPTPVPPTPISPVILEKNRPPTPSGPPGGGTMRLTPTPAPTRTPSRITPLKPEGEPGNRVSPVATPTPRRDKKGPASPSSPKVTSPESAAPSAPPPGVRRQPTPRGGVKPTPTPRSPDGSAETAPPPPRGFR